MKIVVYSIEQLHKATKHLEKYSINDKKEVLKLLLCRSLLSEDPPAKTMTSLSQKSMIES